MRFHLRHPSPPPRTRLELFSIVPRLEFRFLQRPLALWSPLSSPSAHSSTMAGTGPIRTLVPIIPLARDSVLLPGTSLRVPIGNRPDIPALLSAVYSKGADSKYVFHSEAVAGRFTALMCLPMASYKTPLCVGLVGTSTLTARAENPAPSLSAAFPRHLPY